MVLILVTTLLTVAISLLIWAISVQVINARRRAEVKERDNLLTAKMSPLRAATLRTDIAELKNEPHVLASTNKKNIADQFLSSQKGKLHANEIKRTQSTLDPEIQRYEKAGIISTNFIINTSLDSTEEQRAAASRWIAEKTRLSNSGESTLPADNELRKLAEAGIVIKQHSEGPNADLVGANKPILAIFIATVNDMNTFVSAMLKKALTDRPKQLEDIAEKHGITLPFQLAPNQNTPEATKKEGKITALAVDPQQALPSSVPSYLAPAIGVSEAVQSRSAQESERPARGRPASPAKTRPTNGQT
ncbi:MULTISPECIES: hypothetical protein [Nocardiopsidaceae]|uniref:Uncharacterized protein n=1 Tax=Streptomonospora nanhaiensis TaxID=1323731 RepID=A0ABY6YNF4_9ACTN|nr:hypothetical protein [Streptomonospora nanhaiensis]WAE73922.1 hypothetical protein OUQ99_01985 [Streptomonospora nanhaiensis]